MQNIHNDPLMIRIVEVSSIEKVSDQLGISVPTLMKKIANKRKFYLDEAIKLCVMLKIRIDDFEMYFDIDRDNRELRHRISDLRGQGVTIS